jgi:hypothetical protein
MVQKCVCIYIYTLCTTDIYSTGQYVQWYILTLQDEVVNPLTPRKYTALNWSFVFDLQDVLQELITSTK